jgi:AcrR family transcriptional regulator
MDDLARNAGVSKKTIYQFFSDKNELINMIVRELAGCHHQLFLSCRANSKDAIDEVLQQSATPFDTWASVNPGFFYELEKFFPQAWKQLEQHKTKVLQPAIRKNLERGMAENIYRQDLHIDSIADIRLQQLTTALQPATFTSRRISVHGLMNEFTMFYLHGITTEKGKKLLYKYLKDLNEKS